MISTVVDIFFIAGIYIRSICVDMFRQLLLLIAIETSIVYSHSWVECTDYNPPSFDPESLGNFDRARCSGYSRGFVRQFSAGFGVDTGYNHEQPECSQTQYIESDYSTEIPMAIYRPGQVIYISHPAKNHVADVCTNQFIPSTSFELLMSSQPGIDSYDISVPMVGGEHVNGNIDKLGYQRCYHFCEDPDKSHCITAWTIPENAATGLHSFHWKWQFNVGQFYSNCFDAYIRADADTGASLNESTGAGVDITFPPTNAPTPVSTLLMQTPAPSMPAPSTPVSTLITQTPVPSTPIPSIPSIISSSSPSLTSPLARLRSYVINISAVINVTIHELTSSL